MDKILDEAAHLEVTDMGDVIHIAVYFDEAEGFDPTEREYTVGGYPFVAVTDENFEQSNGKKVYRLMAKEFEE